METVAAVATARGAAGIGVVRISGDNAVKVAKACFKAVSGVDIENLRTYSAVYGKVVDGEEIVDEAILLLMRKPHSYTGEDVVEIQCHGGYLSLQRVLETVYKYGAKPAAKGEFTKRAFLNGRIDLTQAEAVMDIVSAKTESARISALSSLSGKLSEEIERIKDKVMGEIALLEGVIDFPDEMEGEFNPDDFTNNVIDIINLIKNITDTYKEGRILKDGLKTAIIGRPNVGKSSLLNALMKEERAIVSDIPGTTRDSIEAEVNIMGVPVILVDTAGIRDANDEIEHIGVDIAKERAKDAELILAVFDSSKSLTAEDREIFSLLKNKDAIFILNKIDIAEGNKEIKAEILKEFPNSKITEISAKRLIGFDVLKKEIANFAEMREDMPSYIINNERVYNSLLNAKKSLEDAINSQKSGLSEDYIVIDLREALSSLGEITGETLDDDIINRIFEDFCIGK